MSFDDWSYDLLWDISGHPKPNLHEDDLQSVIDVLTTAFDAVANLVGAVNKALIGLNGVSELHALKAITKAWTDTGRPPLSELETWISDASTVVGRILTDVLYFKSDLVLAVGTYDIVGVATGPVKFIGEHVARAAMHDLVKKIDHIIDNKIQELESKAASAVANGMGITDLKNQIEQRLDRLTSSLISDMASAAASESGYAQRLNIQDDDVVSAIHQLAQVYHDAGDLKGKLASAPRSSGYKLGFQKIIDELLDKLESKLPNLIEQFLDAMVQALTGIKTSLDQLDQQLYGSATTLANHPTF